METDHLNPHALLIAQIKELYVDRPLLAGRLVHEVVRLGDREAQLWTHLVDTPEILMATLEQSVDDYVTNAGISWRGRLQNVLQRRIRRTLSAAELWFEVSTTAPFVATANVVLPEAALDVHAQGQPAPSKQAAVQSAARLALLTVEHVAAPPGA
jgi:hypothetical protein